MLQKAANSGLDTSLLALLVPVVPIAVCTQSQPHTFVLLHELAASSLFRQGLNQTLHSWHMQVPQGWDLLLTLWP
ncbi:hypothetical protein E8K88_17490 [Lampropedia aestuarii]|uniref:Uncharacterized protein n=1 Tax=Lampropedia aestuarii TaxID=2562762 RepID=A0A4S5BLW3_9BURK|nr:hypothetical protein [Lampropedia aestuarii]THJ30698.1 hypothetical protein E8K88_17490 [Lampropedia aestuarii]